MIKTIIICLCLIGFVLLMFYLSALFFIMAKVDLTIEQAVLLSISICFILVGAHCAYDLIKGFIQSLLNK